MNFNSSALKTKFRASPYYPLYGTAVKKMRSFLYKGKWQTWICSGREPKDGLPFSFAYAGARHNKNYLVRLLLKNDAGETAEERRLGALSSSQIVREAKQSGCDLIFFETKDGENSLPKDQTRFKIPVWISQKLPMEGDAELLHKRESLSPMRRRFRRNPLEFEWTQDEKKLKDFYTQLYVPFTSSIHQKEALIHPFSEVLSRSRAGELLLAYKDGKCVGGNLIEYSEQEGRLSFIGVETELIQAGIISAITFRALLRIREKNLNTANLGDSRGFLKDGAFRFKAGLGCFISPPRQADGHFWTLQFLNPSPALRNVLSAQPFISLDEDGSAWGIFFSEDGVQETLCPGLKGARIFSTQDPGCFEPASESLQNAKA